MGPRGILLNHEIYKKEIRHNWFRQYRFKSCKKAIGLGMEILGCDPYLSKENIKNFNIKMLDLTTLLSEADIVSLHIRLTKETKKLISKK